MEYATTCDTTKQPAVKDTSIVHIYKKEIKVVDYSGRTEIIWGKDDQGNDKTEIVWGKNKQYFKKPFGNGKEVKSNKFNGHWEGIEFGFNGFDNPDYSIYGGNDFMSLNQGKSLEVGFNLHEVNIGLQKTKNSIGLISGLGISFNNYRFENPYTLVGGTERTEPFLLDYDNLSKTKLVVGYLNVPLLLEFQIPVNQNKDRLFFNAGLIGSVKLGSYTKVKYGDTKDKDRNGFNINSFKYTATARVGYGDVYLFGTYSLTPLFETGKGPELTPFQLASTFLRMNNYSFKHTNHHRGKI